MKTSNKMFSLELLYEVIRNTKINFVGKLLFMSIKYKLSLLMYRTIS